MTDIRESLLEVAEWLRDRAEETVYGMACTENPHDFSPDPECATPEEVERHRLACEAWDRGEHHALPYPLTYHATREEAEAYLARCLQSGAAAGTVFPETPEGTHPVHCHVLGWGVGSYVVRDEEMLRMADRLAALAGEVR